MGLTKEKVLETLMNILQKIQEDIVDVPEIIQGNTVPIGDLCYFDSLVSVEVTSQCLETFGFNDLPSFPSLFIDKDKALTVDQVADRILTLQLTNK